jgi:hypothetical protein
MLETEWGSLVLLVWTGSSWELAHGPVWQTDDYAEWWERQNWTTSKP